MELWLEVKNKYAQLKIKMYGHSKNKQNFSKDYCQLMMARDKAKKVAKSSQDLENWSHYRRLRNKVNNLVRRKREKDNEETWMDVGEDMMGKRLWQKVKKRARWTQSLSPRVLKKMESVSPNLKP